MNFIPTSKHTKLVSIIVPCYNEEDVIYETLNRLIKLCNKINSFVFELIFVDDGSSDQTRYLLKKFASKDPRVKIICFSRNFGHQIAVTAGIDSSSGDAVVLIDADLQDPPEIISQMIDKWVAGYDVVYGTRIERQGESVVKLTTARVFYFLLNKLSNIPIPFDTGDFRLMSRKVVNTLNAMPERDRFIRGMVSWVGFKQISLPYKRKERFAGISKYPFKKMISFAISGIVSFSKKPLQLALSLGFFSALLALFGIAYAFYMRIFTNTWVEGWTALMISILFFGGIQLFCIGILGEYIGRIHDEMKHRPLYVTEEYIGFGEKGPASSRSPVSIKTQ